MKLWLSGWLLVAGLSTAVIAQGTVNFANVAGPPKARTVDVPIFFTDRTTRLSGPDFAAQLYAGPSDSALAPVGPAVPFLTGAGAGYFQGGTRVIPTVAPGALATEVVRVWQVSTGPTWEQAGWKGESAAITVITGGAGSPPTLPANLTGLQSFSVIPEPSSTILVGVGLMALVVMRYRR